MRNLCEYSAELMSEVSNDKIKFANQTLDHLEEFAQKLKEFLLTSVEDIRSGKCRIDLSLLKLQATLSCFHRLIRECLFSMVGANCCDSITYTVDGTQCLLEEVINMCYFFDSYDEDDPTILSDDYGIRNLKNILNYFHETGLNNPDCQSIAPKIKDEFGQFHIKCLSRFMILTREQKLHDAMSNQLEIELQSDDLNQDDDESVW